MSKDRAEDLPAAESLDTLTFEQALAELEKIVQTLEAGKADLDGAIGAYERGMALKRHCERKLKEAKAKIDKIVIGADGGIGTTPMDAD